MTYEPFETNNKRFAWVIGSYETGFVIIDDSDLLDEILRGIRSYATKDTDVLREVQKNRRLWVTDGTANVVRTRWEAVHGREWRAFQ